MAIRSHYHVCLQGTAASRPATPGSDLLYYATDTGQLSIYDTGGAAWSNVGFAGLSDPVAIGDGGTGQTSKTPAFDALAPTTTAGDLIVYDGTDNIRMAASADYYALVTNSSATNKIEWRPSREHITLFAAGATVNFTTGAAYAAVFGTGGRSPTRKKGDMSPYRQGRIHVYGGIQVGSVDAYVKIVDVTNTQDMTNTVYINAIGPASYTSSWLSLNAATYGGDAEFEAQAIEASGADVLRFDSIELELR